MGIEIKTSPALAAVAKLWRRDRNLFTSNRPASAATAIFGTTAGIFATLSAIHLPLPGIRKPCLQFGNGCRRLGISGYQPGQRRHEKEIRSSA